MCRHGQTLMCVHWAHIFTICDTYGVAILLVTQAKCGRGKENQLCIQKVQVHHADSIIMNSLNADGKEERERAIQKKKICARDFIVNLLSNRVNFLSSLSHTHPFEHLSALLLSATFLSFDSIQSAVSLRWVFQICYCRTKARNCLSSNHCVYGSTCNK